MSRKQIGLACCTCLLPLVLAGCVDSQGGEPGGSNPSEPVVPINDDGEDGDEFDPTSPPLINQPDDDQPDENLGPEGDSHLSVGNRKFPLDSAIGDIWGFEGNHYNVDFTLTNGVFQVTPTLIGDVTYNLLVPRQASATLYAELYSPGESFAFVTYSYSPFGSGGGALAGNAYFDQGYVAFDADRSGYASEEEKLAIVGGTIEFSGVLPDLELYFSVTLENGEQAEGHYTGLFDFTDRQ